MKFKIDLAEGEFVHDRLHIDPKRRAFLSELTKKLLTSHNDVSYVLKIAVENAEDVYEVIYVTYIISYNVSRKQDGGGVGIGIGLGLSNLLGKLKQRLEGENPEELTDDEEAKIQELIRESTKINGKPKD